MSQTELPGQQQAYQCFREGQIFRLKFRECPGGSGTVGASVRLVVVVILSKFCRYEFGGACHSGEHV